MSNIICQSFDAKHHPFVIIYNLREVLIVKCSLYSTCYIFRD